MSVSCALFTIELVSVDSSRCELRRKVTVVDALFIAQYMVGLGQL